VKPTREKAIFNRIYIMLIRLRSTARQRGQFDSGEGIGMNAKDSSGKDGLNATERREATET